MPDPGQTLTRLLLFALAGAAGTLARYGLAGLVQKIGGPGFPWGTLAVNLLGCLFFGFIWSLAEDRFLISSATRMVLLIGFMGAFTTFSTFAFETTQMLRDAQWTVAAANLAAQNVAGIVFMIMGMKLGRLL